MHATLLIGAGCVGIPTAVEVDPSYTALRYARQARVRTGTRGVRSAARGPQGRRVAPPAERGAPGTAPHWAARGRDPRWGACPAGRPTIF